VLTICNRLGLAEGLSPALTSATRDVQNNISTIAVAPSSVQRESRWNSYQSYPTDWFRRFDKGRGEEMTHSSSTSCRKGHN
jgi:hypothetical protein